MSLGALAQTAGHILPAANATSPRQRAGIRPSRPPAPPACDAAPAARGPQIMP